MGYLLEQFLEKNPLDEDESEYNRGIQDFLMVARAALRDNQPVSMDYIEKGFAVRLQDGTVVPFVDDSVAATGGVEGGVEFTAPEEKPGKGMARDSFSMGITQGDLNTPK